MATPQAEAHIAAQTRLQALAASYAARAWESLPNHDEESVAPFLAVVVPLVLAAQRQSAALVNAFLAAAAGRPPLPINLNRVTGAAIRTATPEVIEASRGVLPDDATGVPPQVVYRRPFVEVWGGLANGTPRDRAVSAATDRIEATAAMDVQNAMRHTLRLVGEQDDLILGYRRVPNTDACPFCKLIAGRRYLTSDLLEVHARCRCGVDVITKANRGDFTGKRSNDLAVPTGVAFHEHGELGPLVGSPDHDFTALAA
jgi:hypothetical protein